MRQKIPKMLCGHHEWLGSVCIKNYVQHWVYEVDGEGPLSHINICNECGNVELVTHAKFEDPLVKI